MIKSELIQKLAEENPHLIQRDLENLVDAILDQVGEALSQGDRVELRGFGAFSVKNRQAGTGRNPRTGETVKIGEKYAPQFKASSEIRDARAAPHPSDISGKWCVLLVPRDKEGKPIRKVSSKHIYASIGAKNYGLDVNSFMLEEELEEYGVYVVPVHIKQGLFASLFVNFCYDDTSARNQEKEFRTGNTEITFSIETRYPYIKSNETKAISKDIDTQSDEENDWILANFQSLRAEAETRGQSMEETYANVREICRSIK